MINRIIMIIMALGAVAGGIDRILGNRFGYGKKFEEGFQYLGPTALSMVGIICLAPLVSGTLGRLIIPVYRFLGVDPAMFGSFLAIDMGGYQLSMELAENPLIGREVLNRAIMYAPEGVARKVDPRKKNSPVIFDTEKFEEWRQRH